MDFSLIVSIQGSSIETISSVLAGPKCPIKKYKTSKYTIGHPLYLHENFHDRYKPLEDLAKDCHLRINIKGGYYQLIDPAESVLVIDADLAIGHAFRFELHDENNAVLCNKICLSKSELRLFISTEFPFFSFQILRISLKYPVFSKVLPIMV